MKSPLSPRRKAPAQLADFQRWMGRATARPLDARPSRALRDAANARLRAANGMDGLERLEVYHRQYWYRLLSILQEEYPCVVHLMGLGRFNDWAMRYLGAHPPSSPYLAALDAEFPAFLRRRYRGARREAVLEAAEYERALAKAFDAPEGKRPSPRDARNPATRWTLAAHVTPLWLRRDLAAYRALCRKDEALTGKFPFKRLGKNGHGLCLHRHANTIYEKPLSRAEFLLLAALAKPRTLDAVFREARRGATAKEKAEMERNAGAWFREWTELGWLTSTA